jgi:polar amino acid transport system substrate-binding protein
MSVRLRHTVVPLAAAVLALAVGGCAGDAPSSEHTLTAPAGAATTAARITGFTPREAGTLTVGTELPNRPWINATSVQDITDDGYETELVNAIASKLGLRKVRWVNFPFDGMVTGAPCPCDVAVDSVTILPARAKVVDFTAPYYTAKGGLLVRKGTPPITDLARARTLQYGAATNTTGLFFLQDTLRPAKTPRVYDTDQEVLLALRAGQIDAASMDLTDVVGAVRRDKQFAVGAQVDSGEQYGAVLPKGSSDTAPVSRAIRELQAEGVLDRLRRKYVERPAGLPVLPVR